MQDLKEQLRLAEIALEAAQRNRSAIIYQIITENEAAIQEALKAKDEPYGSISVAGFSISIPKKVTWDQAKLAAIADDIQKSGEKVSDYIKVSFDVAESKFKAWPEAIRTPFMAARTVQQGNPSVKLATEKE